MIIVFFFFYYSPDNALEENMGIQYKENRAEFDAMAQKWTKLHASQI